MDVMESIANRFSCRSYKADPISSEMLMKLIDAGRMAPTSRGLQPWEFVVITNVSTLRELGKQVDSGRFIASAAACIAVFCQSDTRCAVEDGAAATENILLAATGMGLGSCWIAGDKKPYQPAVERLLKTPPHLKLISLISLGFPAEVKPADRKRKSLEEVLHWQCF
jgi:nitroreductase